jgi:hypothetical protein
LRILLRHQVHMLVTAPAAAVGRADDVQLHRRAGGNHLPQRPHIAFERGVILGRQQLLDGAAADLVARQVQRAQQAGIDVDDAPLAVDAQDMVRRVLDQHRHLLFACAQHGLSGLAYRDVVRDAGHPANRAILVEYRHDGHGKAAPTHRPVQRAFIVHGLAGCHAAPPVHQEFGAQLVRQHFLHGTPDQDRAVHPDRLFEGRVDGYEARPRVRAVEQENGVRRMLHRVLVGARHFAQRRFAALARGQLLLTVAHAPLQRVAPVLQPAVFGMQLVAHAGHGRVAVVDHLQAGPVSHGANSGCRARRSRRPA